MSSRMLEEARACAEVVERQTQTLDPRLETLAEQLRRLDPQVALTVARGSSDHA
ncbi:MAG: iron dicitrate transport regulator FecR, partial [Pseudomonas sp.]|nr:iron dicitrate transport regulator FecR [Pseudomonas sp.]